MKEARCGGVRITKPAGFKGMQEEERERKG